MKSVEMAVLMYKAEQIGGWKPQEVKDFEMKVSKYLEQYVKKVYNKLFYLHFVENTQANI